MLAIDTFFSLGRRTGCGCPSGSSGTAPRVPGQRYPLCSEACSAACCSHAPLRVSKRNALGEKGFSISQSHALTWYHPLKLLVFTFPFPLLCSPLSRMTPLLSVSRSRGGRPQAPLHPAAGGVRPCGRLHKVAVESRGRAEAPPAHTHARTVVCL